MTYQNGGIIFNNVKTHGTEVSFGPVAIQGITGADELGGIINGVDIDWNGAILPNANISEGGSMTINTTGELLNLINEMQKEIYTLAAAVIAIGNK